MIELDDTDEVLKQRLQWLKDKIEELNHELWQVNAQIVKRRIHREMVDSTFKKFLGEPSDERDN